MIKLVYCLRKKADVSQEEFHRYWREQHAPLVTSVAEHSRCIKYIQSHTLDTSLNDMFVESRGLAPAYDGITECWWESEEDLISATKTEDGRRVFQLMLDDESQFIDFNESRVFITRENLIFDESQNLPYTGSPATGQNG